MGNENHKDLSPRWSVSFPSASPWNGLFPMTISRLPVWNIQCLKNFGGNQFTLSRNLMRFQQRQHLKRCCFETLLLPWYEYYFKIPLTASIQHRNNVGSTITRPTVPTNRKRRCIIDRVHSEEFLNRALRHMGVALSEKQDT